MRLEVEVGWNFGCIVFEHGVHGNVVAAKVIRSINRHDCRKVLSKTSHHHVGIRINHDLIDFRNGKQGLQNVMEQGFASEVR